MMKLSITFMLLALVCSEAAALQQNQTSVPVRDQRGKQVMLYGESQALIIGASRYKEWDDLPGVRRDIRAVQAVLEEHHFEVEVIEDPGSAALYEAYRNFINSHGQDPDSRLLLYFAGHGHTMQPSYGGEMGYIVPTDAPNPVENAVGFRSSAMAMAQIEVFARNIQAKHALFVFDACFSGSIFSMTRGVPEEITRKTARPVRQFITSGSADEEVPDVSTFRDQFVKGLKGDADRSKDGYVTGVELGQFLRDQVIIYSNEEQHPQYGKISDPNLSAGDFVFVLPTAPVRPDSLDLSAFIEEANWAEWQSGMDSLYTELEGLDGRLLAHARKIEAWQYLLTSFPEDNPFSVDDDDMRERARQRIRYWQSQIDPGIYENAIGMKFIFIAPGTFQMGSDDGGSSSSSSIMDSQTVTTVEQSESS